MNKNNVIRVNLHLPQTKGKSIEELYILFKNRVQKKSSFDWVRKKNKPQVMIINIDYHDFDYQEGMIVEPESYEEKKDHFIAIVHSLLDSTYILYVFKNGKAYLDKKE